ncbi:substrate-binding periplasmic protein [Arcobacter sp. YIC-310]|uniref:substrate-binding periplasmic protein n=1 Tax=Arcobacter sp. YIC-310 TaxID=3376632 RepID=UPI003C1BBB8A
MKLKKVMYLIIVCFFLSSLNANKLESIKKSNEIKVCIWPEYYGISYLDIRTQKLVGIDSDLAKELAKDLNVTLKYIPSSFATLIKDIKSDKCDIAMFAIGNTKERREQIRFTTPHLSSDIYAITTKNNKRVKTWDDIDTEGIVVAVAKGTYHEPVMKKKLKKAKLLVLNSFKAREEAVRAGRADVFMTDYPFGKRMLAKTSWAKLIIPKTTYHKTPYAWALAYGNDLFYKRVEKFISDIRKDGRLLNLAKQNGLAPIVNLK